MEILYVFIIGIIIYSIWYLITQPELDEKNIFVDEDKINNQSTSTESLYSVDEDKINNQPTLTESLDTHKSKKRKVELEQKNGLNDELENFRKKKNEEKQKIKEEEQKIKDEEKDLKDLINYVCCRSDFYPFSDDPIKDILDTFRKVFIEGNEKNRDLDDIIKEVTEFYNHIKNDLVLIFDDMVRVEKLIDGLQLIPYEELTNVDDFEEEKVKRPSIPQNIKDKVWNRDGGKCVQCGSNENIEFDHIIPFSKGGSSTYRNLQILCQKCNRSKSSKIG